MKPPIRIIAIALLTALAATAAIAEEPTASAAPETAKAPPNPMAPFARLIGGEWHIGPLHHVFEWGVGERSVIARSYGTDGQLASEARWFYHPGEQVIRGYSVDAAGALYEMTTRFEGQELFNQLQTWDADGKVAIYSARWLFTGDDRYDWTLHVVTADGPQQVMAASAVRKRGE